MSDSNHASTWVFHGTATLILENSSTNTWVCTSTIGFSDAARMSMGGGSKSLAGALNIVRITTAGGSDTFDLGAINVTYE